MLFKKTFRHEGAFAGQPEEYFNVVANISRWDRWNPNVHHMSLDTKFQRGATGRSVPTRYTPTTFTIIEVIQNEKIVIEFRLPLGGLVLEYRFDQIDATTTSIKRIAIAKGPAAFLIYSMNAKSINDEFDETLKRLEGQVEYERFERIKSA